MATVTVRWTASAKLQMEELAATGKAQQTDRKLILDLELLGPEDRVALLKYTEPTAYYHGDETLLRDINIQGKTISTGDECPSGGQYYRVEAIRFDAVPTVADIVALLPVIAASKAEADANQARKDHEFSEAWKAHEAVRHAYLSQVRTMAANGDLDGLRGLECAELDFTRQGDRGALQERDEAIKAIESKRADVARLAWIAASGSDYLKRAVAAGYDCKRYYVIERAASEAPGFTVDFDDKAEWKNRSCPSEGALNAEDEAGRLGLGEPRIVWLTAAPQDRAPTPMDEEFEPPDEWEGCEAVAISGFLGKYDLVKIV